MYQISTNIKYKKTKFSMRKILFYTLFFINIISFLNEALLSIYSILSFFVLAILLIGTIATKRKIRKIMVKNIIIITGIFAYLLCSIIFNKGGIGSVINFVYGFIICILVADFIFFKRDYKSLWFISILVNLILIYQSFNTDYTATFYQGASIINPNVKSYVVLYTGLLSLSLLNVINIRFKKIISLLLIFFNFIGILNFGARGSLIPLIVFVIFQIPFIKKLFMRKPLLLKNLYLIIVLGGVFIPIAYLWMYTSGFNLNSFLTGKEFFSGREIIWYEFFSQVNSPFELLFGVGSNFELFQNQPIDLHNNMLGNIANFGFIGFFLYYGFIFFMLHKVFKVKQISSFIYILIGGFYSILIHGYFEATISFTPIFFLSFIFLGIALSESRKINTLLE